MRGSARAVAGSAVLAAGGLGLFEIAMRPTARDRVALGSVMLGAAALAVLVSWALPRWVSRLRTMWVGLALLSMASVLLTVAVVGAAAGLMFLSAHDLKLLLVALAFAGALGLLFAAVVANNATEDVTRISLVAGDIADGNLAARTGVQRRDELGALAGAVDSLVEQLAVADTNREADERNRRALLAAVGHDLRTPLTALQAALEALDDGVAIDRDRYIRSMRRDVTAMGTLVDDLFMLARIEAKNLDLRPCTVDLAELADEALEALAPVADRKGVVVKLVTDGRVGAEGAPELLGRAIRNLLDNAIRHAPVDSEVTVQVSNGTGATLLVRDEGPGFPPDLLCSAFDSFVRADPARGRRTGGSGLGLAIARGVVEAHGGEIWAEAAPGGKVAFRIPQQGPRSPGGWGST